LNPVAVDMEELSVEQQQWLFDVIKEEADKAKPDGNGPPHDVYYKITPDMLQPKMEQKKEQGK
jgi:hypothetical protein